MKKKMTPQAEPASREVANAAVTKDSQAFDDTSPKPSIVTRISEAVLNALSSSKASAAKGSAAVSRPMASPSAAFQAGPPPAAAPAAAADAFMSSCSISFAATISIGGAAGDVPSASSVFRRGGTSDDSDASSDDDEESVKPNRDKTPHEKRTRRDGIVYFDFDVTNRQLPTPAVGRTPATPSMSESVSTIRLRDGAQEPYVGRGGFGYVFRGMNLHTGSTVAIKIVPLSRADLNTVLATRGGSLSTAAPSGTSQQSTASVLTRTHSDPGASFALVAAPPRDLSEKAPPLIVDAHTNESDRSAPPPPPPPPCPASADGVAATRNRALPMPAAASSSAPSQLGTSSVTSLVARELDLLGSLDHPGIIKYVGARLVTSRSAMYLVMELATGGTLSQCLAQYAPLPLALALKFATQLGESLAYLHASGVVHGDLKPDNVLLRSDGTTALVDFGCSLFLAEVSAFRGQFRGTPQYTSPEVARGEVVSAALDVWAFACSVIYLIVGVGPWQHLTVTSQIALLFHVGDSGQNPFHDSAWQRLQSILLLTPASSLPGSTGMERCGSVDDAMASCVSSESQRRELLPSVVMSQGLPSGDLTSPTTTFQVASTSGASASPSRLMTLLRQCFDFAPTKRPSMASLVSALRQHLHAASLLD